MHPVLFSIGKFPIHSYGFMLALSFLFGIWLGAWRAKRSGLDPNAITDVGFWIILSAIVGARLYYVILKWDSFRNDLVSIFNPFQAGQVGIGGLVMYGGFIGAILASILYFRIKKLPFLPYADAVAPGIGLGIFLTRIGCFMNGCCYGAQTSSTMGITFPLASPAGQYQESLSSAAEKLAGAAAHQHSLAESISLYPSQLFDSAGGLIILVGLLLMGRRRVFEGFQFYLVGLLYSVFRFVVDFTRFYGTHEMVGPLSHNQVVCIVLFVVFGGLILKHLMFKEEIAAAPARQARA